MHSMWLVEWLVPFLFHSRNHKLILMRCPTRTAREMMTPLHVGITIFFPSRLYKWFLVFVSACARRYLSRICDVYGRGINCIILYQNIMLCIINYSIFRRCTSFLSPKSSALLQRSKLRLVALRLCLQQCLSPVNFGFDGFSAFANCDILYRHC